MPTKKVYSYKKLIDREPKEISANACGDLIEDFKALVREYLLAVNKPLWTVLIFMNFGLEDGVSYSFADIGRQFNFTRERIRQIQFLVYMVCRN